MSFRKLILIISAFAALAVSCKDDDDSETKPSLKGTMSIEGLPEFIEPNQRCTLTVKGAEHPEDGEINYYWRISPSQTKYDTTYTSPNYIHTFSDTLQTYTVYCYAYAEGYSNNSTFLYTTTMKGGRDGSITGINYAASEVSGQFYQSIGEQTWTTNNFGGNAYGKGFRNSDVMSYVFGRFCNHEDAVKACQSLGNGWTLPTMEDWAVLEDYVKSNLDGSRSVAAALMGDAALNGETMWVYWPAVGDITNKSGFSAIPAGYANLTSDIFTGSYQYSTFWTATSVETDDALAYYKYLIVDQSDLYTGQGDKESFGANVRCIRK